MNTDSKIYPILPYDSNEVFNYFERMKKDYTSLVPEKRKIILSQIEEMFNAIRISSTSFNCNFGDKIITVSADFEFIKKFNAVAQSILNLEKNVQGTHVDVSNILTEIEKTKAAIHKNTEEMIKNIDRSFDQSIDATKENLLVLSKEQVQKIENDIKNVNVVRKSPSILGVFFGVTPIFVAIGFMAVGGAAYLSLLTGGIAILVLSIIYMIYYENKYLKEYKKEINQLERIKKNGPEHDQFIKFIEQKNREKISKGLKPLDLSSADIEQLIKEYSHKNTPITNKNQT